MRFHDKESQVHNKDTIFWIGLKEVAILTARWLYCLHNTSRIHLLGTWSRLLQFKALNLIVFVNQLVTETVKVSFNGISGYFTE